MLADIETATQRKLPPNFGAILADDDAAAAAGRTPRHAPMSSMP